MPNKGLQVTFDPLPIFAAAKTGIASNAPELKRFRASAGERGSDGVVDGYCWCCN